MPLIVPISSVASFGIDAAAARSKALLNEPTRKLPERPRIVVIDFSSRVVRSRALRAITELVVNRPPTARLRHERVGRRGAARAGLVLFRRLARARAQQRIDDAPRLEHAVLAGEQRAIADEGRA